MCAVLKQYAAIFVIIVSTTAFLLLEYLILLLTALLVCGANRASWNYLSFVSKVTNVYLLLY